VMGRIDRAQGHVASAIRLGDCTCALMLELEPEHATIVRMRSTIVLAFISRKTDPLICTRYNFFLVDLAYLRHFVHRKGGRVVQGLCEQSPFDV
jgi:hypothetical protein